MYTSPVEYVIYTNPMDPLQARLIRSPGSAVSMMAVAMVVLASWSDGKNDSVPLFPSLGVEIFSPGKSGGVSKIRFPIGFRNVTFSGAFFATLTSGGYGMFTYMNGWFFL